MDKFLITCPHDNQQYGPTELIFSLPLKSPREGLNIAFLQLFPKAMVRRVNFFHPGGGGVFATFKDPHPWFPL